MCSRRISPGREGGAGMPEHLARTIRDHDPQMLAVGLPVEMIAAVPQADGSAQYWKIVRFPFAAPAGARLRRWHRGERHRPATGAGAAGRKRAALPPSRRERAGADLHARHGGTPPDRQSGRPYPDRLHRRAGNRAQSPRHADPDLAPGVLAVPRADGARRQRRRHDVRAGGRRPTAGVEVPQRPHRRTRQALLRPGPRSGRHRAPRGRAAAAPARDDRRPHRAAQPPRLARQRLARAAGRRGAWKKAPPCSTWTSMG